MTDNTKPVRCGCGGEAQIAKKFLMGNLPDVYVLCGNCSIRTGEYYSAAEAIEAWNLAMGTDARTLMKVFAYDATCAVCEKKKERTAKVIEHDASITDTDGYKYHRSEYLCGNCKKKVFGGDEYCSHCGCRLDWNENIPMEYFESWGI